LKIPKITVIIKHYVKELQHPSFIGFERKT